jgi:hypothetical protein
MQKLQTKSFGSGGSRAHGNGGWSSRDSCCKISISLIDGLRFSLKCQPMISREFRAAIWPTQHLYI